MPTRRQVLKTLGRWFSFIGLGFAATASGARSLWADIKRRVLLKNTDLTTLVNENPTRFDTRDLAVTPIDKFETMGLDDHDVNLDHWQLTVDGAVAKPLRLNYKEMIALPLVERAVLLICPGIFAYHGKWKGLSLRDLLKTAEAADGSTHVTIRGPAGTYEKVERFPISELEGDKLFLAYAVNGKVLPQKHGFPLRLVAEDYYGDQWVKYVTKIEVQKIEES